MSNMKNIVVLVSGGGTNLQALIDAEKSEGLGGGKITCVIASKPDAYALTRAANNGIKTRVLARRDYADVAAYSKAMADALKEEQADLVIYAGFMTILDEQVCDAFRYKMINVHPALIPSFCGKGYYGLHVHEEALKKGVKPNFSTMRSAKIFGFEVATARAYPASESARSISFAPGIGSFSNIPFWEYCSRYFLTASSVSDSDRPKRTEKE